MKKIALLSLIFSFFSCSINDVDEFVKDEPIFDPLEYEFIDTEGAELVTFPNGFEAYKTPEGEYFVGDMYFTDEQIEVMGGISTRGTVALDGKYRWGNGGRIYYMYANDYTSDRKTATDEGIRRINATFPALDLVKCTTLPAGIKDYLYFQNGTGSSSPIGKKGGKNTINIASGAPWGTVVHEIFHSLGLHHEQCRVDRDRHIEINWSTISRSDINYQKITDISGYNTARDIKTIDYNSIMMYSSGTGSNWRMRKIGDTSGQSWGGVRSAISESDKATITYLYGPPHGTIHRDDSGLTDFSGPAGWIVNGYSYFTLVFSSPTTVDRSIVIAKGLTQNRAWGNPNLITSFGTPYSIHVPAGTTSVGLGNGLFDVREEYGYMYNYTDNFYVIWAR